VIVAKRRWPVSIAVVVTLVALITSTGPLLERAGLRTPRVAAALSPVTTPAPAPVPAPNEVAPARPRVSDAPPLDEHEVERLIASGALAQAEELIARSEGDRTQRALALLLRAELDSQRGAYGVAVKHATLAIMAGAGARAYLTRAQARVRLGTLDDAQSDFRKVLGAHPSAAAEQEARAGLAVVAGQTTVR
jgi:hypothetical protein